MAAALFIITAGFTLVYSALKGISVTDIFAGATGIQLNPRGGNERTGTVTGPAAADAASGADPKGTFKGPHAKTLRHITDVAEDRFNLRVSQICRPANAGYGSPTSLHKECRAVDLTGSVQDRVAHARWVKQNFPAAEVFCDQAGMVAPGYDHSDHSHVGM